MILNNIAQLKRTNGIHQPQWLGSCPCPNFELVKKNKQNPKNIKFQNIKFWTWRSNEAKETKQGAERTKKELD